MIQRHSGLVASILREQLAAIGAVWRNHLDAVSTQLLIQRIAVVGAITDKFSGLASIVRSRSTVAPGGLRDGWPHACLPIANPWRQQSP
jgi:hypothetical protein